MGDINIVELPKKRFEAEQQRTIDLFCTCVILKSCCQHDEKIADHIYLHSLCNIIMNVCVCKKMFVHFNICHDQHHLYFIVMEMEI